MSNTENWLATALEQLFGEESRAQVIGEIVKARAGEVPLSSVCSHVRALIHDKQLDWDAFSEDRVPPVYYRRLFHQAACKEMQETDEWFEQHPIAEPTRKCHPHHYWECRMPKLPECKSCTQADYRYKNELDHYLTHLIVNTYLKKRSIFRPSQESALYMIHQDIQNIAS